MFYHLSEIITQYLTAFNVIHYVTFRAIASLLTALVISMIAGAWFIESGRFRSKVREYTPESHQAKNETPTMGGIIVLVATIFSALLWCNLARPEVWIFLGCLIGFGAIGLWDDWKKITSKKGIKESHKFRAQIAVGLLVALSWYWFVEPSTELCFPFFKNLCPQLGLLVVPWAVFILVAVSNAVNLTDGLDGLAIGSLLLNFGTFAIICFLAGHYALAHYLQIPFAQTAEIAVIGATLVGSSLGFLWYNTYPAQVFMGDIGSLALGSGLALMAIMARQELLLVISGGLFVIETLSVMAQVFSYRYFGKRLFKMAPIHHHFELLGWPEAKITVRFGIISFILCLLALITLKMR